MYLLNFIFWRVFIISWPKALTNLGSVIVHIGLVRFVPIYRN
jgi:hypothetical protein